MFHWLDCGSKNVSYSWCMQAVGRSNGLKKRSDFTFFIVILLKQLFLVI